MFARQRARCIPRSLLFLLVACVSFAFSFPQATATDTNAVNFDRQDHRHLRSLQEQQDVVKNIQVELRNILSPLSDAETVQFEVILSNWMDDFFMRGGSGRVRDFSSTVTVQSQAVSDNGSLLITYEALSVYTPTSSGATATNLVVLPYLNIFFNAGLIGALRTQIPSLSSLPTRTISVPLLLEGDPLIVELFPTRAPILIEPPTRAPISMAPLSSAPVTTAPVTSGPTTRAPITSAPVTFSPISSAPVTSAPVTVAPTFAPVTTPVTLAPVTSSPTMAPAETPVTFAPVTMAPVSTVPVTMVPVSMVPVTMVPVGADPVTKAPVAVASVTMVPVTAALVTTVPVTSSTTATLTPTLPQTMTPTTDGTLVTATISDVVIGFPRGLEMQGDVEETAWEEVTKQWWEQYYAERPSTELQDVEATFDIKSQIPDSFGNTLVVDVDLQYRDFMKSNDPRIVVMQPFLDDRVAYVDELRSERAFKIADPTVSIAIGRAPTVPKKRNSGLIVGILFLLLFILAAVGIVTYYSVRSKERRRLQGPAVVPDAATERNYAKEVPTSSASVVPLKSDMSTLGGGSDPYDNKDAQSYDMNSLATSNFDYDKVGAATAPQSKASSMPDASSMASSKSYPESDDMHAQEDQFVIYAPAGRLGLVVDNPDEGAPVIHSIKPDSVLIDQIQVGDRLIGVDEVDVSALSPVKVSKLISKRSTNPLRKLTLTRRSEDDGTILSYGKMTDSQNDTMSRMSGMESGVDTMSRMSGAESGLDTMSRTSGVDTDAEGEGDQMFSSDDETSFIGSMSRVSGDSQSNGTKEDV